MNPKSKYNPVAVDVSKKSLQVQTEKKNFNVSNDAKGHAPLIESLSSTKNPLIVLEASGGYEKPLMYAAHQADVAFCLVNPRRVRAFAISEGIKAKTDPIDAMLLRRFAQEKNLQPSKAPSKVQKELAAYLDRRSQLNDHLVKEKNRLDKSDESILPSIKSMIDNINQQINQIELGIRELIKSHEAMISKCKVMPEIIELSRNQVVAMAGVAPFNRDSGATEKPRRICGGRAKIRTCLYMATQMAARCNHVIKPYVEGLRGRGKPYKCAIIAAMRKLLLHIRSILKKTEKPLA